MRRPISQAGTLGAGLLAATLAFAGCASDSSGSSASSETEDLLMSDAQRSALSDNEVTRDEYDAGFRRYQSCMTAAGYALVNVTEEYEVITFGVPAPAVESGDDDQCYTQEFSQVDTMWQLSVEDRGKVARLLAACLSDRGLDSSGTKLEKEERLQAAGVSLEECIGG